MKQYVVVGNPVAHSRSPFIHAAFAAQFDIHLSYQPLLAPLDAFADTIAQFFERGMGANVTVPFKEEALTFADVVNDAARLAGAANTLSRQAGKIVADNTDGIGLLRDLTVNYQLHLAGQSILLLGAGGAARGVIAPLLAEKPARLTIANRTHTRAEALCAVFAASAAEHGSVLDARALDELQQAYDLVINATSASLQGEGIYLEPHIFSEKTVAYDMMYGAEDSPFMKLALACGARGALDGLGMLVEQAAESFYLWHGVRPETASVIRDLRLQLLLELGL